MYCLKTLQPRPLKCATGCVSFWSSCAGLENFMCILSQTSGLAGGIVTLLSQ